MDSIGKQIEGFVLQVLESTLRRVVREELTAHASRRSVDSAPEWMTVRQAATFLGVHHSTIRNWCNVGGLPHSRVGRHIRIARTDLVTRLKPSVRTDGELSIEALARKITGE